MMRRSSGTFLRSATSPTCITSSTPVAGTAIKGRKPTVLVIQSPTSHAVAAMAGIPR